MLHRTRSWFDPRPALTAPTRVLPAKTFLILALIVLAGAVAVALGQDANWDLQNYHFYDPWAWLNGRTFDHDIAAAQVQTYHNPLGDLPFYWMVGAAWDPRLIAFVLAIPAGIAAFFVVRLGWDVFADLTGYDRIGATLAAGVIGITANMGVSQLGTTFNEWPGAALVVAAIALIVRDIMRSSTGDLRLPTLAAAGIMAGLAMGLKLTAAPFAVGLCVALLLRSPLTLARSRDAFIFGAAVLLGAAITFGWWGFILWRHFHNPFFPYLTELFGSPWWGNFAVTFRDYGPHTWQQWIEFPWRLHSPNPFFVSEVTYTDWRIPLLYSLALFALLAAAVDWSMRTKSGSDEAHDPNRSDATLRFLGIFFATSFVVWTDRFSIARYTVPLELLSGVLIVALLLRALRPAFARTAILVAVIGLLATTRYPDWWRIPYGSQWFDVHVPAVESNALVVLTSGAPVAYVLPFFPQDARHIAVRNSAVDPRRDALLLRAAATTIASHRGPLYALSYANWIDPADDLSAYRVRKVAAPCAEIRTNMRVSPLELCRLERVAKTESP